MSVTSIQFAPLLPLVVVVFLATLSLVAFLPGIWFQARGTGWRMLAVLAILGALANPSLVEEERDPLKDVATIVIDDTPSQGIGERRARMDEALEKVREELAGHEDTLEVREITLRHKSIAAADEGTRAIDALTRLLADVPPRRLAGVVMLTDGQIHDIPDNAESAGLPGPVHVLLTGDRDEQDRRLVVTRAPSYGIVGDPLSITVHVEDQGAEPGGQAKVELRFPDGTVRNFLAEIGKDTEIPLTLEHAGPTILELSVDGGPNELTLANNRAVVESTACATGCGCCWSRASRMPANAPGATC